MPLRANFCLFGSRRLHTVGSGSKMMMMSTVMLIIAAASSKALSSSHLCGIEISQKALTGLKPR
jgi:hypothetical protein